MKAKTIADIVTADIRTASIFKRHGIDFCCGGGKILSDVCKEKKIRVSKITNDIEKLNSTKNEKNNVRYISKSGFGAKCRNV